MPTDNVGNSDSHIFHLCKITITNIFLMYFLNI